jgi:hypothetical protein
LSPSLSDVLTVVGLSSIGGFPAAVGVPVIALALQFLILILAYLLKMLSLHTLYETY